MVRCARPSDLGYDDIVLESKTHVCEDVPDTFPDNAIVLNALHDSMPECDLTNVESFKTEIPSGASDLHCFVYCAQRSCHAAVNYMNAHASELDATCMVGSPI